MCCDGVSKGPFRKSSTEEGKRGCTLLGKGDSPLFLPESVRKSPLFWNKGRFAKKWEIGDNMGGKRKRIRAARNGPEAFIGKIGHI